MTPLLSVDQVCAGYQLASILFDVSLSVEMGEVIAVVGANGAGKTTLLRAISGLIVPTSGHIVFAGEEVSGLRAHRLVERGMALVPEGGRLFPFMTVEENLQLGAFNRASRAAMRTTLDEVMSLFPILAERRRQLAGSLSGGERQMCAIARGLMSHPRFLILDEPSAGLSPVMLEKMFELIQAVVSSRNLTVLLVEQHVEDALEIADRAYVLERGRIVKTGSGSALMHDPDIQSAYMGI